MTVVGHAPFLHHQPALQRKNLKFSQAVRLYYDKHLGMSPTNGAVLPINGRFTSPFKPTFKNYTYNVASANNATAKLSRSVGVRANSSAAQPSFGLNKPTLARLFTSFKQVASSPYTAFGLNSLQVAGGVGGVLTALAMPVWLKPLALAVSFDQLQAGARGAYKSGQGKATFYNSFLLNQTRNGMLRLGVNPKIATAVATALDISGATLLTGRSAQRIATYVQRKAAQNPAEVLLSAMRPHLPAKSVGAMAAGDAMRPVADLRRGLTSRISYLHPQSLETIDDLRKKAMHYRTKIDRVRTIFNDEFVLRAVNVRNSDVTVPQMVRYLDAFADMAVGHERMLLQQSRRLDEAAQVFAAEKMKPRNLQLAAMISERRAVYMEDFAEHVRKGRFFSQAYPESSGQVLYLDRQAASDFTADIHAYDDFLARRSPLNSYLDPFSYLRTLDDDYYALQRAQLTEIKIAEATKNIENEMLHDRLRLRAAQHRTLMADATLRQQLYGHVQQPTLSDFRRWPRRTLLERDAVIDATLRMEHRARNAVLVAHIGQLTKRGFVGPHYKRDQLVAEIIRQGKDFKPFNAHLLSPQRAQRAVEAFTNAREHIAQLGVTRAS